MFAAGFVEELREQRGKGHVIYLFFNSKKKKGKDDLFLVFTQDNMIRIRACEGIMVLASLDDPLFAEIVAKSDLSLVLAKRLEFLFNQIPAHVEPTEIEDIEVTWGLDSPPLLDEKKFSRCRRVAAFFMWLDYCAQLSKEAHPDVAVVLATTIRITFFEKIVTIALGAHHAVLITALIAKCFRDVSSSPLSIGKIRGCVVFIYII